jgi:hypothetical protein
MLNDVWYHEFLKTLSSKYPKKNQLVEALMDLLHIEREAVYRRLRKEVFFTINEFVQIATVWNISVDDILGLHFKEFRFKVQLMDYLHPSDEDLRTLRNMVHYFEEIKNSPDLEYMEVGNKLPRMLVIGFPLVNRMSLLRWTYHAGMSVLPLSKIFYTDEVSKYATAYHQAAKKLPQVSFVVDVRSLNYLIEDIRYFHSIMLVSDEEKEQLKNELYAIIDYGLEIAGKGCWPETGNKVNLYVSQLNIDTSYNYYYYNGATRSSSVHIFGRSEIYTDDKVMIDKIRTMMHAKKQSSILISGVNEQSRIAYFEEQRKMVDSL